MPRRDSTIDFDNLPQMQAERRQGFDDAQTKPAGSVSLSMSGKSGWVHILALVLAFSAIAFSAFQWWVQAKSLESAQLRVAELEKRLSTTDESVSKSGVALQVTIKEIKDKQTELSVELDKLWASAWRLNQTEISSQSNKIKSISATQGKNRSDIDQINQVASALKTEMAALQAKTEALSALEKTVKSQDRHIAELKTDIAALEKANSELKKQGADNAGWIESNNVFRQQTNKSLSRLEQQIKALQVPAPVQVK